MQEWRWEEDSNFRGLFTLLVFKTSAIDHSAIPPNVNDDDTPWGPRERGADERSEEHAFVG